MTNKEIRYSSYGMAARPVKYILSLLSLHDLLNDDSSPTSETTVIYSLFHRARIVLWHRRTVLKKTYNHEPIIIRALLNKPERIVITSDNKCDKWINAHRHTNFVYLTGRAATLHNVQQRDMTYVR